MTKEHVKQIMSFVRTLDDLVTAERKAIELTLSQMIDSGKIPFEQFWSKYPRKDGKYVSSKAWNMLPASEQEKAIAYINIYAMKVSPYIQMPQNYIKDKPWRDEE